MKITIIGASRGIGKQVLEMSLGEEMEVTLLARKPDKFVDYLDKVKVVKGDVLDYNAVLESVKGSHVVVVSVGLMPTRKRVSVFSLGTENVIKAARETNSNPLIIAVTGIGAGDSAGHGGFLYDKIALPFLLRTIYDDKNRQEVLLRNDYDNWIIVRPGFLTNGPQTGNFRTITKIEGEKAGKISRVDVASFIVQQAMNPTFVGQSPLLTF